MARFFIDRPVFAIVISLFLLLIGTLSLVRLPIAEFPPIALPTVQVVANYLGASSDVVEESVTVPLDQQINGVTDMLYINAVSGDDGSANLTVTFALERNPDLPALYDSPELMTDARVSEVIARLDAVDARPYAENLAKQYSAATLLELEAASPEGNSGEILYEIVDYLLKRTH